MDRVALEPSSSRGGVPYWCVCVRARKYTGLSAASGLRRFQAGRSASQGSSSIGGHQRSSHHWSQPEVIERSSVVQPEVIAEVIGHLEVTAGHLSSSQHPSSHSKQMSRLAPTNISPKSTSRPQTNTHMVIQRSRVLIGEWRLMRNEQRWGEESSECVFWGLITCRNWKLRWVLGLRGAELKYS